MRYINTDLKPFDGSRAGSHVDSLVRDLLQQKFPFVRLVRLLPVCILLASSANAAEPIAKNLQGVSAQELVDRATAQMRVDPEASRATAEAALDLLHRQPNTDLEILARLILCDYQNERDQSAALKQLEFAIALLPQAQRNGLRAGVLTCQGDMAETAGDTSKALANFDQAVGIAKAADDEQMLAQALFSRGSLIGQQGNFASGLADLRASQILFERQKMPHHALTVHNAIAILYSRMGDYAQALHIYEDALRQQRKAGMRREQVVTLHNIGRTNENLGQWEDARKAFGESLAIARELRYPRGEAYALRGVAAATTELGDPLSALEILQQSADLQQQTPDVNLSARIDLARGKALHRLRRLPESTAALEQARKGFSQTNAVIELGATYDELAEVHAALGQWRAAYEFRALCEGIERTLFRNRFDQRFATLKVEFDTAAKEKENAALLRENQASEKALAQQRNVQKLQAAVIGLGALLLVVLGAVAWRQRRASHNMRNLAMTDELTGVPNRRSALRQLEKIMEDRSAAPCAVSIIDIDHFKNVNDKHGHPRGDSILKLVAAKLRSMIGEPAFVGRLGGEEFVAVAPSATLESARQAAEFYRTQISTLDTGAEFSGMRMTVSIGVCVSRPGIDTPVTMLQRADAALYAAKHAGRNCVKADTDIAA